MADIYVSTLSKILISLEEVYGLREKNSANKIYADLGIMDVLEHTADTISNSEPDSISFRNQKASRDTILLSYVTSRMEYFDLVKLNYTKYPALQAIAKVLLRYTKASRVNKATTQDIGKIVVLLKELDDKQIQFHVGLAYRYLRMFVVLVLFRNYCDAAIVANLIITQFSVRSE